MKEVTILGDFEKQEAIRCFASHLDCPCPITTGEVFFLCVVVAIFAGLITAGLIGGRG